MLKAAFIFLSPGANPEKHTVAIDAGDVLLTVVGVPNYKIACEEAVKLLNEGISAVELCGGFGIEGTAMIKNALNGKIPVGAVRFENHPGLGNVSGDSVFNQDK